MSWYQQLPRIDVSLGDTPHPVTFIYPYYDNQAFLAQQVSFWSRYPEGLRRWLTAVIVDDGSPEAAHLPTYRPFLLRLFRIDVDVRWNWLAARNIGAHHAAEGWMLLTDMDHVVPVETAQALVSGRYNPNVVYMFARREHSGEVIAPHSASYFMTRETFWRIGGYDEALSGHYGTDGEFRRRVAAHARIMLLSHALVRYEYIGDSSTTRYKRKQPEDAAVQRLVAARLPGWRPKTLSFPYQEVTC